MRVDMGIDLISAEWGQSPHVLYGIGWEIRSPSHGDPLSLYLCEVFKINNKHIKFIIYNKGLVYIFMIFLIPFYWIYIMYCHF